MRSLRGAKCDEVIGAGTRASTGSVVVCVTVCSWASVFEHLRVLRGPTCGRRGVIAGAAELCCVKRRAGALARHHGSPIPDLQLTGAAGI